MSSYKLPDDSAGVSGEIGVLAERDYFFPQNRKSMGDSLMLALDELQKQQLKTDKENKHHRIDFDARISYYISPEHSRNRPGRPDRRDHRTRIQKRVREAGD